MLNFSLLNKNYFTASLGKPSFREIESFDVQNSTFFEVSKIRKKLVSFESRLITINHHLKSYEIHF